MGVGDFLFLEKFSDLIRIFYGFTTHKPPASGRPFHNWQLIYTVRRPSSKRSADLWHLMVHLDTLEQTKFLSFYSTKKNAVVSGLTFFGWEGLVLGLVLFRGFNSESLQFYWQNKILKNGITKFIYYRFV